MNGDAQQDAGKKGQPSSGVAYTDFPSPGTVTEKGSELVRAHVLNAGRPKSITVLFFLPFLYSTSFSMCL